MAGNGKLILVALSLAAAVSLLNASAALALGSGSIAGTVVDASGGAPLGEIQVCAYRASDSEYAGCDETAVDGDYAIPSLTAGAYKVEFTVPLGNDANYLAQYYDARSSWAEADTVAVTEGAAKGGVDAEMHAGGRIAGTVVAAAGEAPLESIDVCAYEAGGPEALARCDSTDGSGEYAISGLPSGSYKVEFAPGNAEVSPGHFETLNYLTQYYDAKATRAQAGPVAVVAGATVADVDAKMQVGGAIAGKVSEAGSADPVSGVQICAYLGSGQAPVRCRYSDGDGEYTISGLVTGSYKLKFSPNFGDNVHAPQYYAGKATLKTANPVAVSQGATAAGVDVQLRELGGIAGTVTAASGGAPISGLQVCATSIGSESSDYGCGVTGVDGKYAIPGLLQASYRVAFSGGTEYVGQYYDDAAAESEADPVAVVDTATTSSVDAALDAAGKISGTVVDAIGKGPLQNIQVCASKPGGGAGGCALTDASGEYTIGGLATGSYLVRFGVPAFNIVNYLFQYYGGHAREGEADPVAVVAGATTPSIDAEMQAGGKIGGKVVDADGKAALAGVQVCATQIPRGGNGFVNCDDTDASGEYTIERLPTGSYSVRFQPGYATLEYVAQYSNGKARKSQADPVAVTAGSTTPGIDAEFHRGGRIEGLVLDAATEDPVKGVNVCLRGNFEGCVATDADGEYTIEGLPSGSYKVGFFSAFSGPGYIAQYYDGAATREAANPIPVSAGSATTGIDARLQRGGEIAGEVTDALSGEGVDGVQACAYRAADGEYEACGDTDSSGQYTIEGLRTGSYEVRFAPGAEFGGFGSEPPNYNYLSQYYDGKDTEAAADPVAVTVGATTAGIDAAMREGGQIEGRVIDAVTKAPLPYSSACVEVPGDSESQRCDSPDANGDYSIEGLPSGSYKVRFGGQGNYLSQYYDGKATEAAAAAVVVTAPSAQTGIDAELHAGGQIKGTVTAAAGNTPLAFVLVCAYAVGDEAESAQCAETNGDGAYTLAGLPTGSYKVEFEALGYDEGFGYAEEEVIVEEEFATQYYDAKSSMAQAVPVSVVAGGGATTAIDARMVEPGAELPSGGGSPGGGSGGSPAGSAPSPPPPLKSPPPKPIKPVKPLKCRKGFQKKKLHGKIKCVKVRKHPKRQG